MHASAQSVRLPQPRVTGSLSLEETLAARQSIRTFQADPLSLEQVSQLLWAAQGVTHDGRRRTAPSAGATYPLEVILTVRNVEGLKPGVYRYRPFDHALETIGALDVGRSLSRACLNQRFIESAAVNVVLVADYGRTVRRYGERGRRYVHMEAGHVGQNLYLQAEALGLGTVAVGAFEDDDVRRILGIREDVLYLFPVGRK